MTYNDELTEYTYARGAIKSFKLIEESIRENHDIDEIEFVTRGMIKDLEEKMKGFEDKHVK